MTATLYPELTSTEVDEIITPLAGVAAPAPAPNVLDRLTPRHLEVTAFGEGTERYTFHRLCDLVAEHVFDQLWDPQLDRFVADAARLREDVHRQLVRDFFGLAVRPLAETVQPEAGTDPGLVYRRCCQRLAATALGELAQRFPVTWARCGLRLERRMAAVGETVRRLATDRPALEEQLGVGGRVVGLALAGDTHAGGRSVSVVELEGGQHVVYKPRPVDAEAAYADLVALWNRHTGSRLQAARVLPRAGYGYVAFVTADPDRTLDFAAVGELAAVLYALDARDMHFENILATRAGPVPIDLETLLHPPRHKAHGLVETEDSGYRRMDSSVFAMGVLPMVLARPDRDGYVDVGFVGGGEARGASPFRRFTVEHPFSADVRVRWDGAGAPAPARRTELPEEAQRRTHAVVDAMVAGFTRQYELVREHRAFFEAAVARCFIGAPLRYVHNPTVQYEQCLRTLTGAAAGADPGLAAGLLKRIAIASRGADHRLVAAECAQMWATDVPSFWVRADDHLLTTPEGTVVADLGTAPLTRLRVKLDRLGEADLAEQVVLIRVALSAKLPDPHGMVEPTAVFAAPPGRATGRRPDTRGALRDVAADLARSLARAQVQDRYPHLPATWIGPVASSDSARPWPPGVLGYDLYTGRSGPALALTAAGVLLEDEELLAAGRRVFDPVADILAGSSWEARSLAAAGVGAYNGLSGATWAVWQAGRLTGDATLLAAARTAQGLVPAAPVTGQGWFDVVSGGVGRWLVLDDRAPAWAAPQPSDAVGHALDAGLPEQLGSSGLAHGLSGLLLLAARVHGGTGSAAAAQLVARCGDGLLSGFGAAGFPLRTTRSGPENHTDSWCNGTAGTLVALAAAVRSGALPADVLDAPVQGLRRSQVSTSLTLCHGVLGLHDALGQAAAAGAAEAEELRSRLDAVLTPDLVSRRLADPAVRYNHSPGLMTGRGGVLWHLLGRLAPGRLASPLALADGVVA
jgi:type 2 lantibiotic biosynthesis protein LanM